VLAIPEDRNTVKQEQHMKTLIGTLVAFGVLAGAAQAKVFDEFNNPRLALPRSDSKTAGKDRFSEALPRISNDDYRQALPVAAPSVDVVIVTP
jgi:hypothetical protein